MQRYTRKQLPDILIVTRQSLQNVYPFINGEYATMIIDEFHHVLSDKNREFVNLWKGACII
jgi:superfamily II DNA or RNA helicase